MVLYLVSMELITSKPQETKKAARKLALNLKGRKVIALIGDLGSGKTTFVQGLAKGLGIKQRVLSPTFILIKSYPLEKGRVFYHIDLYRFGKAKELEGLGLEEILENPNSVVAIEWAEKLEKLLPTNTVKINLEHLGKERRKIIISSSKS